MAGILPTLVMFSFSFTAKKMTELYSQQDVSWNHASRPEESSVPPSRLPGDPVYSPDHGLFGNERPEEVTVRGKPLC